ncbi:MAG: hypothetical protein WKF87_03915 [Chryseolinea sp.]
MKGFYHLFICFWIVLWTGKSHATTQQPDVLIYKGKKYSLYTNPLDEYFRKHPDKKPKTSIISSGNWRGYVATFEIIDSTLFLRDIEIEIGDDKSGLRTKSVMDEVFPGKSTVALEWFDGLLTLPYGQLLKYVHLGYSSAFEYYLILEIRLGNLAKEKDFKHEDYTKFKDKQFELFKQTAEYGKTISILKEKFKSTDEQLESFVKIHGTEYMTYFIED